MGEASPNRTVTTSSGAVFLSYASQDAEPARKICDALRASGIEVWFDRQELRGGDAWDRQIRLQIHDCRLFIPVISAHTEARDEGYFRREWKLAVDRTHDMADDRAFIVPVAVDGTNERSARVPDSFRDVQWTRLPGGEIPPGFIDRIRRLLSPVEIPIPTATSVATVRKDSIWEPIRRHKVVEWTLAYAAAGYALLHGVEIVGRAFEWPSTVPRFTIYAALLGIPIAVTIAWYHGHRAQHRVSRAELGILTALLVIAGSVLWVLSRFHGSPLVAPSAVAAVPAFNPPPHSIAVLPFVNMSGDKEQEYFSDGLTEELLNSLAKIDELQVAARTSAFSYKGKDTDIGTIARKLNVGSVLEGSVRRSGNTVRITTQLVNAVTGFHLWSNTYDRSLGDVLKLETEIADAVVSALKVSLLEDVAAKIELGGTRNPAAFDAYLRGRKTRLDAKGRQDAIAAYTDAIGQDPSYALAFAGRSLAYSGYAAEFATGAAIREFNDKALADAHQALALAPELAESHLVLAVHFNNALDFAQASEAYDRARALAPGNAQALRFSGIFAVNVGHIEAGLTALRRAVVLDPLSPRSYALLGEGLFRSRQYREAVAAATDAIILDADYQPAYGLRGRAYYGLGDLEGARVSCEAKPDYWNSQQCLAVTYQMLGRHAEAEAELAKMRAENGDASAYQYATIYAQWGNTPKALEWLDTARRLRDPGLVLLKTDPLMDPLRNEPHFQAVVRELKFPD
jgi:TolB-like protein